MKYTKKQLLNLPVGTEVWVCNFMYTQGYWGQYANKCVKPTVGVIKHNSHHANPKYNVSIGNFRCSTAACGSVDWDERVCDIGTSWGVFDNKEECTAFYNSLVQKAADRVLSKIEQIRQEASEILAMAVS